MERQRAFGAQVWSVVMPRQVDAEALLEGPDLAHVQGFEEVPAMLAERVQEWYGEKCRERIRAGREEGLDLVRRRLRAAERHYRDTHRGD